MANEHWVEYSAALERDAIDVHGQASEAAAALDEWPELTPIKAGLKKPGPPPLASLPPLLREVVGEMSAGSRASEWCAATVMLGALSAAAMRRAKVRYSGGVRPVSIYALHESASGSSKTTVWEDATEGLTAANYRLLADFEEERSEKDRTFIIGNYTIAMVQQAMSERHPVQAQMTDEAIQVTGNYSNNPNSEQSREVYGTYQSAWSGSGQEFARVTQNRVFRAREVGLTLCLLGQPGTIADWMMPGTATGMAARCLFSYDVDRRLEWVDERGEERPPAIREFRHRTYELAWDPDPPAPSERKVLEMEADGRELLHSWWNAMAEPAAGEGAWDYFMQRCHEHAARIAALLWIGQCGARESYPQVPSEYAEMGKAWAEAYGENLRALDEVSESSALARDGSFASKAALKELAGGAKTITATKLCATKRMRNDPEWRWKVIEQLVQNGHVKPDAGRGGRYVINPELAKEE